MPEIVLNYLCFMQSTRKKQHVAITFHGLVSFQFITDFLPLTEQQI